MGDTYSARRYEALCREADARPTRASGRRAQPPISAWRDLEVVAGALGVEIGYLTARIRGKPRDATRHEAMWLLRRRGRSLPEIGQLLDRDHSSVHHGVAQIDARRRADPAYARRLDALITWRPVLTAG